MTNEKTEIEKPETEQQDCVANIDVRDEAIASLKDQNGDLERLNSSLKTKLTAEQDAFRSLLASFSSLRQPKHIALTAWDRFIILCAVVGFVVIPPALAIAFPVTPPPPPAVTVSVPPIELDRIEDRYRIDQATSMFVAWPDGSGVDADQFRTDCQAVCTLPRYHFHDEPERPLGRVLYVDPEHLLCACFQPGERMGDGVTRYLAWERM